MDKTGAIYSNHYALHEQGIDGKPHRVSLGFEFSYKMLENP